MAAPEEQELSQAQTEKLLQFQVPIRLSGQHILSGSFIDSIIRKIVFAVSSSAALSIKDHWPVSELTLAVVKIVSFYSTETSFSLSNECRFNLNNILLVYVHIKTFSCIQVSFVLVEMAAVS